MPLINKPNKKKVSVKHDRNADIAKIYNSSKWQKLRAAYFMQHPLCEKCGAVTQEIHHIKPISTGKSLAEMQGLAYNPDNLMALCTECHHKIHNLMKNRQINK